MKCGVRAKDCGEGSGKGKGRERKKGVEKPEMFESKSERIQYIIYNNTVKRYSETSECSRLMRRRRS